MTDINFSAGEASLHLGRGEEPHSLAPTELARMMVRGQSREGLIGK